jgi:hypothetical protein
MYKNRRVEAFLGVHVKIGCLQKLRFLYKLYICKSRFIESTPWIMNNLRYICKINNQNFILCSL